jgi:uncharacterized protein
MANPFVWFDLRSGDPTLVRPFYERLLGWEIQNVPIGDDAVPMIGGAAPWASILPGGAGSVSTGWVPYVQVDDVDAATTKAKTLGANVVRGRTEGPSGSFTTITDPAGSPVALWQPR